MLEAERQLYPAIGDAMTLADFQAAVVLDDAAVLDDRKAQAEVR
jgi:hypothetical protein